MNNEPTHDRALRLDAYSRACLTAVAVLLTLLVIGLWADAVPGPAPAVAAEPFLNTAKQRDQFVEQQKQMNAKLAELVSLLRSGRAKVQIAHPDKAADKKDAAPEPPRK